MTHPVSASAPAPASGSARSRWALLTHPLTLPLGFLAVLGAGFFLGSATVVTITAHAAILSLAALSLSFLIGQGGLVSFGHAAPVGIGAYAALIAGESGISNMLVVLPLAFVSAAAVSTVTGAIALRTRGVYFIMISLAFAQMVFYVASSLSAFGGDDGMALASRMTLFGLRIVRTDAALAVLAIGLLALALFGLERLRRSAFGLVLRGCKENESRLQALGFEPYPYRLAAFALAGGIAGLSGALLANQAEFVAPAYMNWHRSGELIVMVVLGGVQNLGGAVIGAVVVTLVEELLGAWTQHWKLGLGLAIIAITILRGSSLRALLGGRIHG